MKKKRREFRKRNAIKTLILLQDHENISSIYGDIDVKNYLPKQTFSRHVTTGDRASASIYNIRTCLNQQKLNMQSRN